MMLNMSWSVIFHPPLDKYTISYVTKSNNQQWVLRMMAIRSLVRLKMDQYYLTKLKNYAAYRSIQYLFSMNY